MPDVTIVEALEAAWSQILEITALFVIPDWSALIALLPVFIVIGVLGPVLSLLALGTVVYQIRKPRVVSGPIQEGPTVAEIGAGGEPVFPPGLPHCRRDGLVYASGARRCDVCHDDLAVSCPMCSVGRSALLDTCGNCGLVLRIETRALTTVRRAGPKPGGAAAA